MPAPGDTMGSPARVCGDQTSAKALRQLPGQRRIFLRNGAKPLDSQRPETQEGPGPTFAHNIPNLTGNGRPKIRKLLEKKAGEVFVTLGLAVSLKGHKSV